MLAHTQLKSEFTPEKAFMPGRTKAKNKSCFCPNSACLADEVLIRTASSFPNVWLVTDEEVGTSWLMIAETPSCPHCGSTLVTADSERKDEVVLQLM